MLSGRLWNPWPSTVCLQHGTDLSTSERRLLWIFLKTKQFCFVLLFSDSQVLGSVTIIVSRIQDTGKTLVVRCLNARCRERCAFPFLRCNKAFLGPWSYFLHVKICEGDFPLLGWYLPPGRLLAGRGCWIDSLDGDFGRGPDSPWCFWGSGTWRRDAQMGVRGVCEGLCTWGFYFWTFISLLS